MENFVVQTIYLLFVFCLKFLSVQEAVTFKLFFLLTPHNFVAIKKKKNINMIFDPVMTCLEFGVF